MLHSLFQNGRKCFDDFECQLKAASTRLESLKKSNKRVKLESVSEVELSLEQDLTGMSPALMSASLDGTDRVPGGQEAVDKVMENEAFLDRLANALAESPMFDGVNLTVIEWTLARNVDPSYYS